LLSKSETAGVQMRQIEGWLRIVGGWILDIGYWILDTGYWMLDIGCWMWDSSHCDPANGGRSRILDVDLLKITKGKETLKFFHLCMGNIFF